MFFLQFDDKRSAIADPCVHFETYFCGEEQQSSLPCLPFSSM